jgi:type IV pilus assembly protein PilE
MRRDFGVTLIEILTVVVALAVVVAVAIPLWRTHQLRERRQEAIEVLLAIQTAQDRHFGAHARYADAHQLGVVLDAVQYTFEVKLSDDALGYVASAITRVEPITGGADARCARMSIDQHGRRSATDSSGEDSTADCWKRK